jgi:hypothetical protein
MRLGIDVGIDAQRHRRHLAHGGARAEQLQSSGSDSTLKQWMSAASANPFPARSCRRRKTGSSRRDAGGQRAAQFAFRNHVDAGSEFGQRLQHGLVGIGLHRVADHRVDIGEGARKHGSAALSVAVE